MNYKIISNTENGEVILGAETADHAEWVAERMAEDFGLAKIFEFTGIYNDIHRYKVKTVVGIIEGG